MKFMINTISYQGTNECIFVTWVAICLQTRGTYPVAREPVNALLIHSLML